MNIRIFNMTARHILGYCGLFIVLLLADITINRPYTDAATSDLLPQLPVTLASQRNSDTIDIQALYAGYDAPVAEVTDPAQVLENDQSMPLAEQEKQQGLLNRLYIGEQVYQLTAILQQQQYIATLTVSDARSPQTATAQRLSVQAGDTLQQYQVLSVTARRVTLQQGERTLWLQLFVPQQTEPDLTPVAPQAQQK